MFQPRTKKTFNTLASALVSASVIAGAALYVAAPTASAVEITMAVVGPKKCAAAKFGAVRKFTLYGRVTGTSGAAVSRATVVVNVAPNLKKVASSGQTSNSGYFRMPIKTSQWVKGKPGTITVSISGNGARGSTTFPVTCPSAIKVSAKVVKRSVFVFLPISTY